MAESPNPSRSPNHKIFKKSQIQGLQTLTGRDYYHNIHGSGNNSGSGQDPHALMTSICRRVFVVDLASSNGSMMAKEAMPPPQKACKICYRTIYGLQTMHTKINNNRGLGPTGELAVLPKPLAGGEGAGAAPSPRTQSPLWPVGACRPLALQPKPLGPPPSTVLSRIFANYVASCLFQLIVTVFHFFSCEIVEENTNI